jgi:hypothetical protein
LDGLPVDAAMVDYFTLMQSGNEARNILRSILTIGGFIQARERALDENQDVLLNYLSRDFEQVG